MSEGKVNIGVKGFYSNRNKRKWIGLERSVNEEVKKLHKEKIPKAFQSRLLGPSTSWKIFFRQKDAFDFSRSKSKDSHVLAFESESYEANSGQRMYLVASYPVFWHYYSQLKEEKRHHYEVIPEGAVCKLYFDLEFKISLNPKSNGNKMVELLIQYICSALAIEFEVECTREDVMDLDASTNEKFSRHLIFQLKHAVFKDNIHAELLSVNKVEHNKITSFSIFGVNRLSRFVSYIISQWMIYRQSKSANVTPSNIEQSVMDTDSNETPSIQVDNVNVDQTKESDMNTASAVGDDGCLKSLQNETKVNNSKHLESAHKVINHDGSSDNHCDTKMDTNCDSGSEKCEMNGTDKNRLALQGLTKYSVENKEMDKRYLNVLQNYTIDELDSFLVKNKNDDHVLFCDLGVYTKNRNFRLYMSPKLNKKNPLVLSSQNRYVISEKDEEVFFDSLVSNARFSTSTKVLIFEKEADTVFSYTRKRSEKLLEKDTIDGYSVSPYPEVDEYITSLITKDDNKGAIRHWTYFHQGETLLYEISRYRFCHNIGRQHRSNNIMYIVDLHRGVFYQKCHDPECHAQNYKSPDWKLPSNVLPDSYFNDIEDEFDLEMDDQELLDSTLELEQSIQNKSIGLDELNDDEDADLLSAAELMDNSTN